MVNTPTLARGLAGLVSNKELLHNTWKEICHVVGKANWLSCWRANWLSCWRANCLTYSACSRTLPLHMCDTTLVLGICWLHSSLFTTYPSSFAWLHFSLFTLHSSLFTLFTIVAVLRGESCGEVGGTLPSPWEHRGHRHEGWFPPWGNPWGRGQKSESVSSNPEACVLTATLRTRQKKYALSCSVIDGRDRSG